MKAGSELGIPGLRLDWGFRDEALEEIQITSDTQMIPPLWQKAKKN